MVLELNLKIKNLIILFKSKNKFNNPKKGKKTGLYIGM